jgi:hypothetical protein
MFTDADIEMAELAAKGDMLARGICPICEDDSPLMGPTAEGLGGYHVRCLEGDDHLY